MPLTNRTGSTTDAEQGLDNRHAGKRPQANSRLF
jgi:hypothetical protein